jgi:hypothetical protein
MSKTHSKPCEVCQERPRGGGLLFCRVCARSWDLMVTSSGSTATVVMWVARRARYFARKRANEAAVRAVGKVEEYENRLRGPAVHFR